VAWSASHCLKDEGALNGRDGVSQLRASGSTTLSFQLLDAETRSIPRLLLNGTANIDVASYCWSHLISKCGTRAVSKSQMRHHLGYLFKGRMGLLGGCIDLIQATPFRKETSKL
jgi:hypothetical protein